MDCKRYIVIQDTFGGWFKKGEMLTELKTIGEDIILYSGEYNQAYPISDWQINNEIQEIDSVEFLKTEEYKKFNRTMYDEKTKLLLEIKTAMDMVSVATDKLQTLNYTEFITTKPSIKTALKNKPCKKYIS